LKELFYGSFFWAWELQVHRLYWFKTKRNICPVLEFLFFIRRCGKRGSGAGIAQDLDRGKEVCLL